MDLEAVIGLEIHIQLKTKSKMFCTCDNSGENQLINTCVCEICLGHPGTLPVPNKRAIELAIKTAIALNCEISEETKFDRKHYFYPDLPKGYQISQYDKPLGKNGYLVVNGQKIRIHRLHLEEDAAKLLHSEKGDSVVDYNRAGAPLMEIVTEPDIHDSKTAGDFLRELRAIARVLEVSDADMEKGHLRCDANISLRPVGEKKLYPKTEIKNLNSFKAVEQALGYEIKQQTLLWEKEEPPLQLSTRGWDADQGMTIEQREKESAHDYRYFPEPDIPPLKLKVKSEKLKVKSEKLKVDFDLDTIKSQMPELPQTKRQRFAEQYGFSAADAAILTRDYGLADYTEKVMSELNEWLGSDDVKMDFDGHRAAKLTANWLINNLAPMVNDNWHALKITPENLAEFISLIAAGRISSKAGQNVLKIMFDTGQDPTDVISTENLAQVDDEKDLVEIIKKVIAENPKVIADYRKGKENAVKFFIGAVMRETKGRAKPQKAEELLKKMLSK